MYKNRVFIVVGVVLLAGCSGSSMIEPDRKADVSYADDQQAVASVVVPESLVTTGKVNTYKVAPVVEHSIQAPSILPPGSQIKSVHQVSVDDVIPESSAWLQPGKLSKIWRHVGSALEGAGFTILEQDQTLGVYYVWRRGDAGDAKQEPDVYQVSIRKHSHDDVVIALLDELSQPLAAEKAEAMMAALKTKLAS
jgi:uncharacterized lipoprotein